MANGGLGDVSFLGDIPIEAVIELGRAKLTVKELAQLSRDDIVELDRMASQPLDLLVGGKVFARGEVVVVDDRIALRVIEVIGHDDESQG